MSFWRLVLASLRHFRRTHAGVLLGTTLGAAVLVGALLVGDSVRYSLRRQALARIGRVDVALVTGDRFFRAALSEELPEEFDAALSAARLAPALRLPGVASAAGGARRANDVAVHGVDARFFDLALEPRAGPPLERGQVLLNGRAAAQLGVGVGDPVLLRVELPSALPRDVVLASTDEGSLGLRATVVGVLGDAELGRFGLQASQVAPFNAFLSLEWLQREVGLEGRANLILAGGLGAGGILAAEAALRAAWTLADGELELATLAQADVAQLSSSRVFLDAPVAEVAESLDLALLGVLTYFVNEVSHGERSTPYSMVCALGPLGAAGATLPALEALVPDAAARPWTDDEIVIGEWLAEDLAAGPGDTVELTYFVPSSKDRLAEESRTFRVRAVVPMQGPAADPTLMPAFPGLSESEHCRDWDPGVALDLDRIRQKDEDYWEQRRGTPKAFVTLAAGREMWASRFGSLTALRVPRPLGDSLGSALRRDLDPASLGLFFRDVRGPALAAGDSATDFGGLFLGLSFFLIVAALLLTSLLFVFGVEQRAEESGVLLALGFTPARVRRLFLAEGAALALVGSGLGALLGAGYTAAVLRGLATVWRGAVGATTLEFHAAPGTILVGALASVLAAAAAMRFALGGQVRRSPLDLLRDVQGAESAGAEGRAARHGRWSLALAGAALAVAVAIAVGADPDGGPATAGAFFGAGAALLVSGVALSRWLLAHWLPARLAAGSAPVSSVRGLGLRNGARRPGRSVATVTLLACGTFLVVSIGVHHKSGAVDAGERSSGTGGFALFGRSTLPVYVDLGTERGRDAFALRAEELAGVEVVAMRVHDGDDASCLNLGSPQSPRLVGVEPALLADRGAFGFARPAGAGWSMLDAEQPDGAVPAIGDHASVTWTLHKKIGDTIEYLDERGQPFQVRIVATLADSILQGNLLIGEREFQARFPSEGGRRLFLIDAPPERAAAVSAALARALQQVGLELTPAARRLDEFNAVQNTYLRIFQMLGGLGLLLGSAGLGVVVLRNALERRRELAVVRAVGFPPRALHRLLLAEHAPLLGLGLAIGVLSAALALWPAVRGAVADAPTGAALPLVALVAAGGFGWVWLASVLAVRGSLIAALRDE